MLNLADKSLPRWSSLLGVTLGISFFIIVVATNFAQADGPLSKVNHIVIVMQENHSFDNYFGALTYAPGSPYHLPVGTKCPSTDHLCLSGLNCVRHADGSYTCSNSNPDTNAPPVYAFHDANYCPAPDLDHSWPSAHREGNYQQPNSMLKNSPNDGFVRVNDETEQHDSAENATEDDTIGFYNEADLPFYYSLAETFAVDDQYFCDVVGPTIPNRFYLMAATSFGHLTTNELVPPSGGYKPITGTIFDLLDKAGVSWVDYYSDTAQGSDFRNPTPPHFLAATPHFFSDATTGNLPSVAFVDPLLVAGLATTTATDEHPPHDIRSGQYWVARVIDAVRNGPNWKDSIVFLTYDEHGGFYDHFKPAAALQGGALNPDGINPGQCEDLSSRNPGGGANCNGNQIGSSSIQDAETLCPALKSNPTGPYPSTCSNFNQYGFRVPFVAISPFSKPHYVSHTVADHTAMLKLIEVRFLAGAHLTKRDQYASSIQDLFDFKNAPSMNASVQAGLAAPPNTATDGNGSCQTSAP